MSRRRAYLSMLLLFGAGLLIGGLAGVFVFIRMVGGSGEPSVPISAPTLSLKLPTLTPVPSLNQSLFRIVPEESEARYIVDERRPFIIGLVGRTNQVAGDLIVDFDNPANSQVGAIRINLRALRTNDRDRDSSVRGAILLSAQPEYEFTDFVPMALSGVPDSVTVGEPVTFQVTGDLPLRGITRSVTFDVTVTLVSETELQGLARTTILRADYGILEGGLVEHGVAEEIMLELEFVARAVKQ